MKNHTRRAVEVAPRTSSHPSSIFSLPPKKVIKAQQSYTAQRAGELSFIKGDFFYVINELPSSYEVINPAHRTRGLVPQEYFDSIQNNAPSNTINASIKVNPDSCLKSICFAGTNSIVDICIPYTEMGLDFVRQYSVKVHFSDQSTHILKRVWDEFWVLHLSLLNHFPKESGRTGKARIIPFLRYSLKEDSKNLRRMLELYMQEVIKLPKHILYSSVCKRFFMLKAGDLNTEINLHFNSSDTLLDLLDDLEFDDDTLQVTIIAGKHRIEWQSSNLDLNELWNRVERMDLEGSEFTYEDECGAHVSLKGDEDLQLLVRTNPSNLVFHFRK